MNELLYKAQGSHNVRLINISVGNVGDMSGSRRHRDVVQGLRCVFEIDIHRGRSGGPRPDRDRSGLAAQAVALPDPTEGSSVVCVVPQRVPRWVVPRWVTIAGLYTSVSAGRLRLAGQNLEAFCLWISGCPSTTLQKNGRENLLRRKSWWHFSVSPMGG